VLAQLPDVATKRALHRELKKSPQALGFAKSFTSADAIDLCRNFVRRKAGNGRMMIQDMGFGYC
jgi:hypothetical protein